MSIRAIDRRRAVCRRTGELLRHKAEQRLLAPAKLNEALLGDDEAAAELVWAVHEVGCLGWAGLAAYLLGTPLPAYRELLSAGWSKDWLTVTQEVARNFGFIRRLFKAARYEHCFPDNETVIYRGASGVDLKTAAKGLSWTRSRDVACWFAFRYGRGEPIVVTASVDSSKVIFYDDDRYEQELILRQAVPASLDPDPSTWQEAMERYQATIP